jgi:hypothetical protein
VKEKRQSTTKENRERDFVRGGGEELQQEKSKRGKKDRKYIE